MGGRSGTCNDRHTLERLEACAQSAPKAARLPLRHLFSESEPTVLEQIAIKTVAEKAVAKRELAEEGRARPSPWADITKRFASCRRCGPVPRARLRGRNTPFCAKMTPEAQRAAHHGMGGQVPARMATSSRRKASGSSLEERTGKRRRRLFHNFSLSIYRDAVGDDRRAVVRGVSGGLPPSADRRQRGGVDAVQERTRPHCGASVRRVACATRRAET